MRSLRVFVALFFVITHFATPQQIGQNKAAGASDTLTLSVKAQLVVESVVAKISRATSFRV